MEKDIHTKVQLIKHLINHFDEFVADLNTNKGLLILPEKFVYQLQRDGLPGWAFLYSDFDKIIGLTVLSFFDDDTIEKLKSDTTGEFANQLDAEFLELVDQGEIDITEDDFAAIAKQGKMYNQLDQNEQIEAEKVFFRTFYSYLALGFNFLALMSYGKSMGRLIQEAEEGDDKSFCKAIRIDRTVLTDVPYFRKRIIKAQLSMDKTFLGRFSRAITAKPILTKFTYRKLSILFFMLEQYGYLDIELKPLLGICEEVGVYGRRFGIYDENSLSKKRNKYYERQGTHL